MRVTKKNQQQNGHREIVDAVKALCSEKDIEPEVLFSAIEEAMKAAYKKNVSRDEDAPSNLSVTMDRNTGDVHVFARKTITDDAGKVYEGLGLADFTAAQNKKRFVEDVYGHTDLYEDAVVGFVNRCSVITGVETPLLASMDMGHGNEGPCGPEGYHKGSVFASQLTGPILVKNPALLKIMVQAIYRHRGETCPEIPVDQYMAEGWAITAEQLKARCQK